MIARISQLTGGLLLGSLLLASPAAGGMTTCRLSYAIDGWSFIYKNYIGTGTVTCSNGQRARVAIETHGGGFTLGKSEIRGSGRFTDVRGISEVFGIYAEANAHAGFTHSADGRILTRGIVSLALSGTGRGVDLGLAFGSFAIQRRTAPL